MNLFPGKAKKTQPDPFWNNTNSQCSPLAILQAANLYVYTMNNPVRWNDPNGLFIGDALREAADRLVNAAQNIIDTVTNTVRNLLPPINITQNGNDVTIVAHINIWSNDVNINSKFRNSDVTLREAVIGGITTYWGGDRGGLNVDVTIVELNSNLHLLRDGQQFLSIEIRNRSGRSYHEITVDDWSTTNVGNTVLFTTYGSRNTLDDFMRTAAHEFGHAMGIGDGYDYGYNNRTGWGDIMSIMTRTFETGATRLDVELALRAHERNSWSRWIYNNRLINEFGITRTP